MTKDISCEGAEGFTLVFPPFKPIKLTLGSTYGAVRNLHVICVCVCIVCGFIDMLDLQVPFSSVRAHLTCI